MDLYIDFESASELDVTEAGAYAYAAHPSTRITRLGWAIDDGPVHIWRAGQPFPTDIIEAINRDARVHAHNAQFERCMWPLLGVGATPNRDQWRCSAAQCRAAGLPGALERAAKVAGLELQKDMVGRRVMLKSARGVELTAEEEDVLDQYCIRDVEVERELAQLLPPLEGDELYTYYVNEYMNDRGIQMDVTFALSVLPHLQRAQEQLNARCTELTNGKVTKITQNQRIAQYCDVPSVDKRVVEQYKAEMDSHQRALIEIRQLGAKSSAAKYKTMLEQVSPDGRLRGQCVHAGAGQTGRASSKGAQLHNLPRDVLPDADERIAAIKRLSPEQYQLIYDEPIIHTASRLLRPTFIAPEGKTLVVGDWSGIEARKVPWLASKAPLKPTHQKLIDQELAVWSDPAGDRYIDDAMAVFHVERDQIDDDRRQVGKVVRLALQFCGATGALMQMAAQYGLDLDARFCEAAVDAWREANPWVLAYGDALESAATRAYASPETLVEVGNITYGCTTWGGKKILRCMLPSGRIINYYDVQLKRGRYGQTLSSIKPRDGQRADLWRGIFVENVAQASCNDHLRRSMVECHGRNWPLVWHVHDEIVLEMEPYDGLVDEVRSMMELRPEWAEDFPLIAKVFTTQRYSK